jgi:hypothetical protein
VPPFRPLTRDLAGALSDRLPPGWIQLAVLLAVGTSVVLASSGQTTLTADTAGATLYLLSGVVQAVVLTTPVLVWFAPHTGLALAAASSLLVVPLPDTHVGPPGAWLVTGSVLSLLAVVDQVTAARRRALAGALLRDGTSVVALPPLPPETRRRVLRSGAVRRWVGFLLLAASAGPLVLLVHDLRSAADFRADAEVGTARVTAVSDDGLEMRVDVDGRTYEVPLSYTSPQVRDVVRLRFDPATGRAEPVDDVFDPTMALIPLVGCLVSGAVLVRQVRQRRARLATLLDEPLPAVVATAVGAPRAGGALLAPVDDLTFHVGTAPGLLQVAGPSSAPPVPAEAISWDDRDLGGDLDLDDDEEAGPGPDDEEEPFSLSGFSDEELLALARAEADDDDEPSDPYRVSWRTPGSQVAPLPVTGTPVVVMGLAGDDDVVALGFGPTLFVTTRPLRPPRWRFARGTTPLRERPGAWTRFELGRDRVIRRVGRRFGRWVPWLALPAWGWLLREGLGLLGWSVNLVIAVLTVVGLAWTLSRFGHPRLDLQVTGIRARGPFVDRFVPWSRVTGTAADDEALVVRFDDGSGGDALLLPLRDGGVPLTRDGATPAEVAARVQGRAGHALPDHSAPARYRLSAPVVVASCWLVVSGAVLLV